VLTPAPEDPLVVDERPHLLGCLVFVLGAVVVFVLGVVHFVSGGTP
jgi:hypothetical protein